MPYATAADPISRPRPMFDHRPAVTWTECDCQRAGLPLRSVPRRLPGLAAPILGCRDEQSPGERLSVLARIGKLPSTSHAQTHRHSIPYLCQPPVGMPQRRDLRVAGEPAMFLAFATA